MTSRIRIAVKVGAATLLLGATLAAVFAPLQLASGGSPRLSAFSDGPPDLSSWRHAMESQGFEVRALLSSPLLLVKLAEPGRSVWVAVGPERPLRADEIDAVGAFLDHGGSILLADSAGSWNALLGDLPLGFANSRLLDERFDGNASFVVAQAVLGQRTFDLRLNNPSALLPREGFSGRVLASSSNASFLDVDASGAIDQADVRGPFAVLAEWETGRGGRVLVSSDLGIFLNDAFEAKGFDHAAFHQALAGELLPSGGRFLVDESLHYQEAHVESFGVVTRTMLRAGNAPANTAVVVGVAGVFLFLIETRGRGSIWARHKPTFPVQAVEITAERLAQVIRDGAERVLVHQTGIPTEQLRALGDADLRLLTRDEVLRRAISEPELLNPEEVSHLQLLVDAQTQRR